MLRQAPTPRPAEEEVAEVSKNGKKNVTSGNNAAQTPSASPDDEIHIYIIRWFIGTCIDMTVLGSTTVMELKSKITKITGSKMSLSEQQITLKGLNLKDGDCLCEVGVADEAVLVLMDGEKPQAVHAPAQPTIVMQAPPVVQQPVVSAPVSAAVDPELKKQTEELHAAAMASQAELSKATALLQEEIVKGEARENAMKEEMERRVKVLEESIRNEVKQEVMLQQKTEVGAGGGSGAGAPQSSGQGASAPPPKMSSAGDLESDDEEEEILTRTEIAARMKESEIKAKESEDRAKAMEDEMRQSMERLRASNDETRELKEALELAKIQREKLVQEKEVLLLKPKQSGQVGKLEDDEEEEEEEEDGPLSFPDDSDDEKEGDKERRSSKIVVSPKAVEKKGGEFFDSDENDDAGEKLPSYESIWDKLDKNKDGKITPREVIVAIQKDPELAKALGLSDYIHEGETRDSLMALFQAMDKDNDDVVDKREFMKWERKAHKSVKKGMGGGGEEGADDDDSATEGGETQ